MKIYVIVSFRPHTGDYFFISNNLFDEDNKVELVSVPILGIIFLSGRYHMNKKQIKKRFRPHTGDYFFIPTLYSYDN